MLEAKHYDTCSPFLYPIEQIVAAIPDYTQFIKKPIDLNHIKARIASSEYDDVTQVNADMKLMVSNATKFNPPADAVYLAAKHIEQLWGEIWKGLPPKESPREESEDPLAEEYVEDDESDGEDCECICG
jgi:bromodomain-containing factor 1